MAATGPAHARPAFGVVNQGTLAPADFDRMEAGGVQTLRFLVRWGVVQPQPGVYDWSSVDPVVAEAQAHGIRLLPFVYGVPRGSTSTRTIHRWTTRPSAAPGRSSSPRSRAATARAAASSRAGRSGRSGAGRSGTSRTSRTYWESPQSPRAYGDLVKLSAQALRAVDPRAKVVLAGVAAVRDGLPWATFLRQLLAVPGLRHSFDFVGFHPYSQTIPMLRAQIERIRTLLSRAGHRRTRLAVTEIGWASDGERPRPLVVGPRLQAILLQRSFALLSRRDTGWHISDIQWYAWQDSHAIEDGCVFCEYAGLFDSFGQPKPAWGAFRRAVRD